ncbi:MAG: NlpC/P60 family protein, partial [Pseudoclavibacter sp.]|nr:NlpC/P60 family protein [Pseudoclavibacter sp.]
EESAASASSGGGEQSSGSTQTASTSGGSGSSYGGSLDGVAGIAESMMGGGSGWLCTDFTRAVYAEMGIQLPAGPVSAQAAGGTQTSDPQVGDLVIFTSGHVGIYAGGGMMWDNPGEYSSYVGWQNVYRSIDVIGSEYYYVTYR